MVIYPTKIIDKSMPLVICLFEKVTMLCSIPRLVMKVQGIKLPLQNKYPLHYAMLAILLCCVHIYLLHRLNGNVVHGIKLSAHSYSYFIIMWLFTDKARTYYNKIQNKALGRLVVYIG